MIRRRSLTLLQEKISVWRKNDDPTTILTLLQEKISVWRKNDDPTTILTRWHTIPLPENCVWFQKMRKVRKSRKTRNSGNSRKTEKTRNSRKTRNSGKSEKSEKKWKKCPPALPYQRLINYKKSKSTWKSAKSSLNFGLKNAFFRGRPSSTFFRKLSTFSRHDFFHFFSLFSLFLKTHFSHFFSLFSLFSLFLEKREILENRKMRKSGKTASGHEKVPIQTLKIPVQTAKNDDFWQYPNSRPRQEEHRLGVQ